MSLKKNILIGLVSIVVLVCILCAGASSASSLSDDPADSYVVQTAPNEDSSIKLWFDYSFRKTFTSDKTSTGMNTFSIYMAKNEIEDAQFVLYSDTDKTGMTATISQFTDNNGNTVDTDIYYEMYVTTYNLNSTTVWGSTEETTFIREGETPDPIVPLSKLKTFKLNGGKSQAFLIRAKTTAESVSGWYSAQLDVKNSAGQIVKTATVYLYVWNVELSEKTALETAFYIGDTNQYGGTYKIFYDYLLENRICGMDLPTGHPSSTNEYLMKDRVVSARITDKDLPNTYLGSIDYMKLPSVYSDLSSSPNWDEIKDKLYFYLVDEPLPEYYTIYGRQFDEQVRDYGNLANNMWYEKARQVTTTCEDHIYGSGKITTEALDFPQEKLRDSIQGLIEDDVINLWCVKTYELTPYNLVMSQVPRQWENYDCIRNSSNFPVAAMWGMSGGPFNIGYLDWEGFYGAETGDRIRSVNEYRNNVLNRDTKSELWAYCAGYQSSYSYANHIIENTGLQTKILWWQLYQEDVTGYLYYGTNQWDEHLGVENDTTVTGAKTTCGWRTNTGVYGANNNVFGDGVLFYGKVQGKVNVDVIGTLRVEIMRDGIEEYQMLTQLSELKGEAASKEIVSKISNNVVDYISMPKYNRSAWDSSMDEYDIMEATRRYLGNALEAASNETQCKHTYDDGVVTKEPTCTKTGLTLYTCTKCGAQYDEVIPSGHTYGNTFVLVDGKYATCSEASTAVLECSVCGFRKTDYTWSNHNNPEHKVYAYKNTSGHSVKCDVCDGVIADIESHTMFTVTTKSTCQVAGSVVTLCKQCGYETDRTDYEIIGHEFVDGYCTMCGLSDGTNVPEEPEEPEVMYGDTNGDGKINALDANYLAQIIVGNAASVEAADISKDGKVNATDSNLLKQIIAGTYTIT